MKLDLLNFAGEKIKDINLDKTVFGIEPNDKVLRDAIILQQASLRQGTAKTKTRSEVSGGGRKPWKQKGTGKARQGSIRAVQWVGGGVAFGPTPRSYDKKQNKKERRLAIKSAYAYKFIENKVICVENLNIATPKTKEIIDLLNKLNISGQKVLIVVKQYNENMILASRNMKNVLLAEAKEVGVLEVVRAEKILIENEALNEIMEVLK